MCGALRADSTGGDRGFRCGAGPGPPKRPEPKTAAEPQAGAPARRRARAGVGGSGQGAGGEPGGVEEALGLRRLSSGGSPTPRGVFPLAGPSLRQPPALGVGFGGPGCAQPVRGGNAVLLFLPLAWIPQPATRAHLGRAVPPRKLTEGQKATTLPPGRPPAPAPPALPRPQPPQWPKTRVLRARSR